MFPIIHAHRSGNAGSDKNKVAQKSGLKLIPSKGPKDAGVGQRSTSTDNTNIPSMTPATKAENVAKKPSNKATKAHPTGTPPAVSTPSNDAVVPATGVETRASKKRRLDASTRTSTPIQLQPRKKAKKHSGTVLTKINNSPGRPSTGLAKKVSPSPERPGRKKGQRGRSPTVWVATSAFEIFVDQEAGYRSEIDNEPSSRTQGTAAGRREKSAEVIDKGPKLKQSPWSPDKENLEDGGKRSGTEEGTHGGLVPENKASARAKKATKRKASDDAVVSDVPSASAPAVKKRKAKLTIKPRVDWTQHLEQVSKLADDDVDERRNGELGSEKTKDSGSVSRTAKKKPALKKQGTKRKDVVDVVDSSHLAAPSAKPSAKKQKLKLKFKRPETSLSELPEQPSTPPNDDKIDTSNGLGDVGKVQKDRFASKPVKKKSVLKKQDTKKRKNVDDVVESSHLVAPAAKRQKLKLRFNRPGTSLSALSEQPSTPLNDDKIDTPNGRRNDEKGEGFQSTSTPAKKKPAPKKKSTRKKTPLPAKQDNPQPSASEPLTETRPVTTDNTIRQHSRRASCPRPSSSVIINDRYPLHIQDRIPRRRSFSTFLTTPSNVPTPSNIDDGRIILGPNLISSGPCIPPYRPLQSPRTRTQRTLNLLNAPQRKYKSKEWTIPSPSQYGEASVIPFTELGNGVREVQIPFPAPRIYPVDNYIGAEVWAAMMAPGRDRLDVGLMMERDVQEDLREERAFRDRERKKEEQERRKEEREEEERDLLEGKYMSRAGRVRRPPKKFGE